MKTNNTCTAQHIFRICLGLVFLVSALAFAVMGLTFLPVIGFILALPVAGLGVYFIQARLNDQCDMDISS